MIEPHQALWQDLNVFVKKSIAKDDFRWQIIKEHPFNLDSIDQLLEKNFNITLFKEKENQYGYYLGGPAFLRPGILLNQRLINYPRDLTLFHELGHAWYDHTANFPFPDLWSPLEERHIRNGAIIEWLARQWRATPNLLRHTIHSFGLKEYIYDRASYEAFAPKEQQLGFPFYDKEKSSFFRETMMDDA